MGLFNWKKERDKKDQFANFLDDLTNLEINTVIKKGMVASPLVSSVEKIILNLCETYNKKLHKFDSDYECYQFTEEKIESIKALHYKQQQLLHAVNNGNDIAEKHYSVLLRIGSFCSFVKHSTHICLKNAPKKLLYNLSFNELESDKVLSMQTSDKVKFKRLYDLSDERIVMQTRFSIDGDVITRIEEEFASSPNKTIIEAHDKHTKLSVDYWKSLIGIAKDLISGLLGGRKKN